MIYFILWMYINILLDTALTNPIMAKLDFVIPPTTDNISPPKNMADDEIYFLAASSKGLWDVTDALLLEVAHLEASADLCHISYGSCRLLCYVWSCLSKFSCLMLSAHQISASGLCVCVTAASNPVYGRG